MHHFSRKVSGPISERFPRMFPEFRWNWKFDRSYRSRDLHNHAWWLIKYESLTRSIYCEGFQSTRISANDWHWRKIWTARKFNWSVCPARQRHQDTFTWWDSDWQGKLLLVHKLTNEKTLFLGIEKRMVCCILKAKQFCHGCWRFPQARFEKISSVLIGPLTFRTTFWLAYFKTDKSCVAESSSKSVLPFILNTFDLNGNCALHYAISHANLDVVSVILKTEAADLDIFNKDCVQL